MEKNISSEVNQDLLTVYACHKTQIEIKNRALRELYTILEFYILAVVLYEFIKADDIKDHISKEEWKALEKWRKRFLKKSAVPGSETVNSIASDMQIDFDHYFIESIVTIDNNSGELLGINFGTHDIATLFEEDRDIANRLVVTVVGVIESKLERATIAKLESFFRIYASVVDKFIPAHHYHYASGVMFKSPEICDADKYLIMYYYTYLKLISMSDVLIPQLSSETDRETSTDLRVSTMKLKATIIESFGACIKEPKTPLTNDIAIRLNDHVDPDMFVLNRRLRDNLHYSYYNILTEDELERIDRFQREYFNIVFMSFDEKLKIKAGRWYRFVMWLADHTDTECVKARRQLRKEQMKKAADTIRKNWLK